MCSGQLYLLCLYNQVAPATAGTDLYSVSAAKPPVLCETCQPTCIKGLCHPDYTPVVPKSTLCPTCRTGMTDDLRHTYVDIHNYYRRLLATGWAEDKQIKYAPRAKKMMELNFDKTLEKKAYAHTKKCPEKELRETLQEKTS
ncbi:hypothetical protein Aduo_011155 [Ancylostoma duodenale]